MKMDEAIFDSCVVSIPLFLLRKRLWEITLLVLPLSSLFRSRHRPSLPILARQAQLGTCLCLREPLSPFRTSAQCGALSEPGCCPRNQEQAYPDHDNPDASRDALAVRCEPFGSNCCRD